MKKIMLCLVALATMLIATGCKKSASLNLVNQTQYEAKMVFYNGTESSDAISVSPKSSRSISNVKVELMDSVAVQLFDTEDPQAYSRIFRSNMPEAGGTFRQYSVIVTGVSNNYPLVSLSVNSL